MTSLFAPLPPTLIAETVAKVREQVDVHHLPGRSTLLAGGTTVEQRIAANWLAATLIAGSDVTAAPGWLSDPTLRTILEGRHLDYTILDSDSFRVDIRKALGDGGVTLNAPLLTMLILGLWNRLTTMDWELVSKNLQGSTKGKSKKAKADSAGRVSEMENSVQEAIEILAKPERETKAVKALNETVKNLIALEELRLSETLKVDFLREWSRISYRKPQISPFRVNSILGANHFNISSANALLKTAEEPAEFTAIILGAVQPNRLPVTILSRCLRIELGPPSQVVDLEERAKAQSILSDLFANPPVMLREDPKWIRQFQGSGPGSLIDPATFIDACWDWLRQARFRKHGLAVAPDYADHPLIDALSMLHEREFNDLGVFLDERRENLIRNISGGITCLTIIFRLAEVVERGILRKKQAV